MNDLSPDSVEQAEKLRVLKRLIEEAIEDVRAGNVSEWNFDEFLREARSRSGTSARKFSGEE